MAQKRTGSPLVLADAENWLVNGAISSAVLLAFISILVIKKTALDMVFTADPIWGAPSKQSAEDSLLEGNK